MQDSETAIEETDNATEESVSFLSLVQGNIAKATGYKNTALMMNTIIKIAGRVPSTVSTIDGHSARELAAAFLKGVELCGELASVAAAYEAQASMLRKQARAKAILITAKEKGIATAKEREIYADMDASCIEAEQEYNNAHTFRVLIENKREDLNKAHYLMRKIAESDQMPPGEIPSGTTNQGGYIRETAGGFPAGTTRVPFGQY